MGNKFNVTMDEDDIEGFLEVVPKKLTNKELLDLEQQQQQIAEEKAREKETTRE